MNILPKFARRSIVAFAALAIVAGAQAQPSSTKPIRLVVPFGPGGVADLTARTVAQKMSESMGQSIIIDNKPGAGGVVATDTVAKAAPDGLTMLLMSNGNAVSVGLFNKLPFDTVKDFAPVSMLGYFDMAVVTQADSKFKTLQDLLAYAKANPGKVNIGTINTGSTQHLAAELFKRSTGVDVQVIPFNGSPQMINALRGGQVDAGVEILAPILGQINGKALRAIATMGTKRSFALPDTPTVAESGFPGFNVASWNALAVPAKTPPEVIARLNKEANKALASPDVKERLRTLGVEAAGSTPEQQSKLLKDEIKRWSDVIRQAGIPKQ
ncbi:tripartite tricarboxylate transporter substrate binding protein [Variovorax sp. Sphag1AA]|uniref:Bug family tripartite tricarboxylate transporter substrate binding protein n=1 Tax=Variovorax sp. Sphag1AA TaxID=2587027 RepID=UPI00160B2A18|nr:tripartite tricarboxylate transporter substrate binding protein [Variovorax sp. Sphag1AA]MBB3180293.1 tripartite-type tricarboxylate transporter receptor subunit TctC [Variovorax sp. Sphag1AA]